MSNAYFERSPGNAEWARELLKDRFRAMIRGLYTDATVRGLRFIRLIVSIARLRFGGFDYELR